MKEEVAVQGSLFEENFLIRTLGALTNTPDLALTELVANAWDAGASEVHLTIPSRIGGEIVVKDNGTGLTPEQFRKRWMTLGYDRQKNQGDIVEFPPGNERLFRRAYGRNGVGRHGMLCFADQYVVETTRDDRCVSFVVQVASGAQPFTLTQEVALPALDHGTTVRAIVEKNLPDPTEIREIISARFLHNPEFNVYVNGKTIEFMDHKGLANREQIHVNERVVLDVFIFDSSKSAKSHRHHGVAFWVDNRLVGTPSWVVGDTVLADGRTTFARRHTIVVKTQDLINEIEKDWSAFKKTELMQEVYQAIANHIRSYHRGTLKERISETQRSLVRDHRDELAQLTAIAKVEVSHFIEDLTASYPTEDPEFLSAAIHALIKLEKSRSGTELLQKISLFSESDIVALNRFLDDWSITDALCVLEEIDKRLLVLEALERFSADSTVDELKTLHPLVVKARWLFGPEFESPLFASNVSLKTAMLDLFGTKIQPDTFENHRQRPDLMILEDSSISGVCFEDFDESSQLATMKKILLLELKRGGYTITRKERMQAQNYVEELMNSGHLDGAPSITAFVIGHKIDPQLDKSRMVSIGENEQGRVEVVTYAQLVRTAKHRLFHIKDLLHTKYQDITDETLVQKVLNEESVQSKLFN